MKERTITHLNIIGFKAAVAEVKDISLRGRPFVIAGATGGRNVTLDCSPEAIKQGITPGMTLTAAQKRISDLIILSPDIPAYELMNTELEKIAERYAPLWENDRAGNLYLDITGTKNIFGSPMDCSSRILNTILDQVGIKPAAAVACNKLVSKVATRAIRPMGLIQVQAETEAEFLQHQAVRLLPGMGAKLQKTAAVVGIREIGEIANLSAGEALSLFGKNGGALREMALGIDNSPVIDRSGKQKITQQADFNEDVIDEIAIRGAIEGLAGFGGFEMRRNKLGAALIRLVVFYADGMTAEGQEKRSPSAGMKPFVLDRDITEAAYKILKKTAVRRIRIRSIGLSLEEFIPLDYAPELFEPETEIKNRQIQEAVDKIQNRFGMGKITRGLVFTASNLGNGKRLITAGGSN
ncbi:MAG: DNA polymerase [Treponema sp.]|nr:DNA polymerase [Treponema sp.]